MSLPANILQQVITYQESALAYLENSNVFISRANTKFREFQKETANLGTTVSFDLPPRYIANDGLIVSFQSSEQRVDHITADKSKNIGIEFDTSQFVFNVKDYMEKFGKSAIKELGATVEADVANVAVTNTYRFYGDGFTAINSFGQLAKAIAYFNNYGSVKTNLEGILPDIITSDIVNTGLNQFVMDRNEKMAASWKLGAFKNCEWYESNLLPRHVAGGIGNAATVADRQLTVVSTNDPTGANITQITCTTTDTTDLNAIKLNDLAQFVDGVSGQPNLRYLTFIGHKQSSNPVQVRITADAASTGGTVVINVYPALVSVQGKNQNINNNIVPGMKLQVMPTHRAGLIMSGRPLFLAMPSLPDQTPFPTANKPDDSTGVALRMYYGCLFGQDKRGMVHDVIYGYKLVDEYAMRIVFPDV
jgi:hypothetical protein